MLTMLATPLSQLNAIAQEVQTGEQTISGSEEEKQFAAAMQIDSQWEGGYSATVTLTNTGESVIDNWHMELKSDDTIETIWNASVLKTEDGHYVIKNAQWNQDIAVGASVSFGFTASYKEEISQPEFLGMPIGEIPVEETSYICEYHMDNQVENSFYDATFSIQNVTEETIEDWMVAFEFEGTIESIWNAEIVSKEENHYVIRNATYNQNITGNSTVFFGFNGTKQENVSVEPQEIKLYQICYEEQFSQDGTITEGGESADKSNEDVAGENESQGDESEEDGFKEDKSEEDIFEEDIPTKDVSSGDVSGGDVSGGDILSEDTDTDGDGIADAAEERMGLDPYSTHTDGDSLPDGYELYTLYPILLHAGYEESAGINAEDDYDGDGLTNVEEYQAGTNPGNVDTDGDNLTDKEELTNYSTAPDLLDTDNDGLNDGLEIGQGMNPLHQDSDGDGILDGAEIICQQLSYEEMDGNTLAEAGVLPMLEITGSGDFSQKMDIVDISDNAKYENLGFAVGNPYDFSHEEELTFEKAVLTFQLSEEVLATNNIQDLAIAWYDEEAEQIELQNTTCNSSEKIISAEVTHFSTYMVINKKKYLDNLNKAYAMQQKVYDEYGESSYVLLDKYLTWEEAQDYCESLGGHLAVIDSEEEQNFIDALVTEKGTRQHYWIGTSDAEEQMVWSNNSAVAYEEWKTEHTEPEKTRYKYSYYSEQKYTGISWSNVIRSYNIESEFPMFVFKHTEGVWKNGNVPVTYYEVFAFDENRTMDGRYRTYATHKNIRMERYTCSYTWTYDANTKESSVETSLKLYDIQEREVTNGNFYYLYGPKSYIEPISEEYAYGRMIAYTLFRNDMPTFDNYEAVVDYFMNGDDWGQLNPAAVPYTSIKHSIGYLCEWEENGAECNVLLSTGEYVQLNADPRQGDETVDTDEDGIPDIVELGEEISLTIPGSDKTVRAWTYRSNPAVKDTDGDSFWDGNDPVPTRYDLTVQEVYGNNVIKLNTGATYCIFGRDINEFYEQYYTRVLSPNQKDILETLKVQLELNHEKNYTVAETAFFCNIDIDGVKDYIAEHESLYKQKVYAEFTGQECSEKEAEDFFAIITSKEAWHSYIKDALEQILAGKYTDKGNLAGTLGEVGVAFTGLDVVQDIRDLSHDMIYWENSWEHLGETLLDGVSVIPVVGVLGKTDEMLALLNRGDNLFELRRIKYADKLLTSVDELKYMTKTQELANTADNMMPQFGESLYRDILNTCENVSEYRSLYSTAGAYDNAVISALSTHAEDLQYLAKVDGDLLEDVVKEVGQSGSRNAEELQELVDRAIDEAKEQSQRGKRG